MITHGDNNVGKLYFGDVMLSKAYFGDSLVYGEDDLNDGNYFIGWTYDNSDYKVFINMTTGTASAEPYVASGSKYYIDEPVTGASYMFYCDSRLSALNLRHFDTSQVTIMQGMFELCVNLSWLDLSNFDTSKVTNIKTMFRDCRSLSNVDLSNWNTSNVTSMFGLFNDCSSLTSLDLSNFDTSNVTSMQGMFGGCSSLTTLNLSNFDTSKVTYMASMFNRCSALTKIYCKKAFYDWCIANASSISLPTTMKNGKTSNYPDTSGNWVIMDPSTQSDPSSGMGYFWKMDIWYVSDSDWYQVVGSSDSRYCKIPATSIYIPEIDQTVSDIYWMDLPELVGRSISDYYNNHEEYKAFPATIYLDGVKYDITTEEP